MTAPRSLQGSGNTPTCVGKTNTFWQVWNAERKHPHMRGEDNIAMSFVLPQIETPPHAWGRHAKVSLERPKKGNTPTCVGKTRACPPAIPRARETPPHAWGRPLSVRRKRPSLWKHPHMRGEDMSSMNFSGLSRETPPHAWGRRCKKSCSEDAYGNTPTCVGKTGAIISLKNPFKKHPHMRGEDIVARYKGSGEVETPPHAWGRQAIDAKVGAIQRNTPTCVGKTAPCPFGVFKGWKHPHMRGEDGKGRDRHGNTPTCVGKTLNDH